MLSYIYSNGMSACMCAAKDLIYHWTNKNLFYSEASYKVDNYWVPPSTQDTPPPQFLKYSF